MLPFLIAFKLLSFALAIEPIVKIQDGTLKGSILKDIDGKDFFSFQGIPFAAPPIGPLRFKDPQPVNKWTGIKDATKEGPVCLQKQFLLNDEFTGDEDCLHLNVYTPELKPDKKKAVLVFIHGGGFIEGSGIRSYYGPEFLVSGDIVLVTINYRVGILGFMNFNNPNLEIPGNAGLKDQAAALKWIQRNIHHFGGDRNKVTISGESAGAASVHLHVLSPYSKGLFHRALIQSGTAAATWCNGERNNGVPTAKYLGFQGDNEADMLKFLQNATVEQLKEASINGTILIRVHVPLRFGPSVEIKSKNAFLTDYPRNLIKNGMFNRKVEIMIGITSTDGMIMDTLYIARDGWYTPWPIEHFIPYYFNLSSTKRQELIHKINTFYNFNDTSNPNGHLSLQTDNYFTFPMYETVFGHLLYNQTVYVYLFSSDSEMNFWKYSNPITSNYEGACHMEDLWYLYTHAGTPHSAYIPGSIENKAIKNTVRLVTNFAKFGKPTLQGDDVQWIPATSQSVYYVDINLSNNTVGVEFYKERAIFWCDIYREYGYQHFCPSTWTNLK